MDKTVTLERLEEAYKNYSVMEDKFLHKVMNYMCEEDYDIKKLDEYVRHAYSIKLKKDNLLEYFIADNKPLPEIDDEDEFITLCSQ